MQTQPNTKIDSIEGLRFVAAFLVVLYHAFGSIGPATADIAPGLSGESFLHFFRAGEIGVDIFFVISGYVITASVLRQKRFVPRAFLLDRFWRIYPVLWAALLFKIALDLLATALGLGASDLDGVGGWELFGQFLLAPRPMGLLIILPTWTLTFEIIFYAIFAAGFLLHGLRGAAAGVLAWYAMALVYAYGPFASDAQISAVLSPLVVEFLLGMGVAWLSARGRLPAPGRVLAVGGALFVAVLLLPEWALDVAPRELVAGVPSALVVYGFVGLNPPCPRWLMLGGRASYVLYLTHIMVLGAAAAVLKVALGVRPWAQDRWILVLLAATVVFSVLVNVALEHPFQQWRRRRKQARQAEARATGAGRPVAETGAAGPL